MQEKRSFLWHNDLRFTHDKKPDKIQPGQKNPDIRANADALRSLSGFAMADLHADLQGTGFAKAFMEEFRSFLAAVRDRSGNPKARKAADNILKRTSATDSVLPKLSDDEMKALAVAVLKPYVDGLGKKHWFRYPVLKEWQIMPAEERRQRDLEEYRKFLLVVRDSSGNEHAASIAARVLSRPLVANRKLTVREIKDLGASISFPYPNDEGAIRRCSFTATKEWKEYVGGLTGMLS